MQPRHRRSQPSALVHALFDAAALGLAVLGLVACGSPDRVDIEVLDYSLGSDARDLEVSFWLGCQEVRGAEAAQSDDRVMVTIRVENLGGPCEAIQERATYNFSLDEPLGSRRVIDGSSDEGRVIPSVPAG